MKCPLCDSNSKLAFKSKGVNILDCQNCAHRFAEIEAGETHVNKVYDNTYFNGGGAGYSDYSLEADLLRKRGQMYAKKIAKYRKSKGRILDVGAAAGFVLKGYQDEGWKGIGLEPNKSIGQIGKDTLGLDIRQNSFEKFKVDEKFDLISMIQVVAHLYDQRTSFENAAFLLNDNGLLLIETWNRDSISAKFFEKNWHEYSPPSVLHWFSLAGLTDFLKQFGFEKIADGRPSKKISGKHAKSLLKHTIGNNFLLNLIPEKFNFPYPSEDLFWALYRKKSNDTT